MSGTMQGPGGMQGLGATGTGYNAPQGGNSLLQQLLLARMLQGGGGGMGGLGGFAPQPPPNPGVGIPGAPMQGLILPVNRMGGGAPMVPGAPPMQPPGAMPGMASAMGGPGQLQALLQALRQQQGQPPQQPGGSSVSGFLSGLTGANIGTPPAVGTETMSPYWQGMMSGGGIRG